MNPLAQLDQLNLDADTKIQVEKVLQTLLEQAAGRHLADLKGKDVKIEALTHD